MKTSQQVAETFGLVEVLVTRHGWNVRVAQTAAAGTWLLAQAILAAHRAWRRVF